MFSSEQEMSEQFERFIKVKFGNSYIKEYQGLFGIPDFVFYVKEKRGISIISFELKLKDWKRAAKQAFRYKSFSNISYVVLPLDNINFVLEKMDLFEKYNIGLASFNSNNDFKILYKPQSDLPYCDDLTQKIVAKIKTSKKRSKNYQLLI